jgi:hypothetical protein
MIAIVFRSIVFHETPPGFNFDTIVLNPDRCPEASFREKVRLPV